MALEEKVIEMLKANRRTMQAPPRAITGVLQQTVFPSLERPKAKPAPVTPALPSFTGPTPAPVEPPVVPEGMPTEPADPWTAYVHNTARSDW